MTAPRRQNSRLSCGIREAAAREATKNQGSSATGIGSAYFRPRNREEEKPPAFPSSLSLSSSRSHFLQSRKHERQRVARPSSRDVDQLRQTGMACGATNFLRPSFLHIPSNFVSPIKERPSPAFSTAEIIADCAWLRSLFRRCFSFVYVTPACRDTARNKIRQVRGSGRLK